MRGAPSGFGLGSVAGFFGEGGSSTAWESVTNGARLPKIDSPTRRLPASPRVTRNAANGLAAYRADAKETGRGRFSARSRWRVRFKRPQSHRGSHRRIRAA